MYPQATAGLGTGLPGHLFSLHGNCVLVRNWKAPLLTSCRAGRWVLTRRFFSSSLRWVLSTSLRLATCFSAFFLSVKNWFRKRLKSALIESASFWRASSSADFCNNCCSRSESCRSETVFQVVQPEALGWLTADCTMTGRSLGHFFPPASCLSLPWPTPATQEKVQRKLPFDVICSWRTWFQSDRWLPSSESLRPQSTNSVQGTWNRLLKCYLFIYLFM